MPVNKKLMANLIKQYGGKKGVDIYYAMENKARQKKAKGKAKR